EDPGGAAPGRRVRHRLPGHRRAAGRGRRPDRCRGARPRRGAPDRGRAPVPRRPLAGALPGLSPRPTPALPRPWVGSRSRNRSPRQRSHPLRRRRWPVQRESLFAWRRAPLAFTLAAVFFWTAERAPTLLLAFARLALAGAAEGREGAFVGVPAAAANRSAFSSAALARAALASAVLTRASAPSKISALSPLRRGARLAAPRAPFTGTASATSARCSFTYLVRARRTRVSSASRPS